MSFSKFQIFNFLFKLSCVITASSMVIYWIMKFHQNMDQDSIEYVQLENVTNFVYPELSICVYAPFFQTSFNNSKENISIDDYQQFLVGNRAPNSAYRNIEFNNVTIDLFEYFKELKIQWNNDTPYICNDRDNCPFAKFKNSFNGFLHIGRLFKCFSVEPYSDDSRVIIGMWLLFEPHLVSALSKINEYRPIAVTINYPNQFLRNIEDFRYIWLEDKKTQRSYNAFKITHIELIQRRFKEKDPCFEDWRNYDQKLLQKHIESVDCKPPYLTSNKSLCITKQEMRDSVYNLRNVRQKYPKPCHEITNIAFTSHYYRTRSIKDAYNDYIGLRVVYPGNVKLIKQSQLVDIHSLIGNIGGYIGLFLGKYYWRRQV